MLSNSIRAFLSEQIVQPTIVSVPNGLNNASESVVESTSDLSLRSVQGGKSLCMPLRGAKDIQGTGADIQVPQDTIVRSPPSVKSATWELHSGEVYGAKSDAENPYQIGYPPNNFAARGPLFNYWLPLSGNPSYLEEFHTYFRASTSTSDDLMAWLMHHMMTRPLAGSIQYPAPLCSTSCRMTRWIFSRWWIVF
jgi:hypothetical protein